MQISASARPDFIISFPSKKLTMMGSIVSWRVENEENICILCLDAVNKKRRWYLRNSTTQQERDKLCALFEQEVLSKLDSVTWVKN
jgi:hypothetical protein